MESRQLFRIVLALAVGGSGAAMYASDASAQQACHPAPVSNAPTWSTSSVCCTAPNGSDACSWGEIGGGSQWMKATADGPPPPPSPGCNPNKWGADGLNINGGVVAGCSLTGQPNGTFVGIGNTAQTQCNGAFRTRITYFTTCL
jgi:hypothetical protein